jgi:single-strand DNA-binding protein
MYINNISNFNRLKTLINDSKYLTTESAHPLCFTLLHQNFTNTSLTLKFNIMKDLRNRVQLIGNLGMDPEVKKLDGGSALTKFSLATTQTYINTKGEKVKDTQWHNLVLWGKMAETAGKYLKKGSEIAAEGKIVYRTYEKNGETKYITEIVVSDFLMMPKAKKD